MFEKIYFKDFCVFCSEIENNSSRIFKIDHLSKFFEKISSEEAKIIIYCFQNTLGPIFNTNVLGISESLLKKWILKFFNINEQEFEILMKKFADIGKITYEKKNENLENLYCENITINFFWETILEISKIEGKGSQKKKEDLFISIFKKLDPISSLYFLRILEGNLRIGISEKTILESLSKIIQRKFKKNIIKDLIYAYSIYPDLGFIGEKILEKNFIDFSWFSNIKIQPGIPVFPQAAERIKKIEELNFSKNNFYIQPKYDGLRLQIHFDNEKICCFSRNLLNMNNMFPEIEKFFKEICQKNNIKKIIVDGEILVFDLEKSIYSSFQKTIERRRKYEIEKYNETHPVHYVIFDILILNDESLIEKPYENRIKIIENIFKGFNKIYSVKNYFINNLNDAKKIYEKYENMDYEGIMIKNPNSFYQPGERNKNWLKLKKIQKGFLSDTIDVVVIGYFLPRGKRIKQGIGAILTAVYNNENDSYESIAKIGTGLTEEKWKILENHLSRISSKEKPEQILSTEKPDFWCFPKIIVSVETDSISKSNEYFCGLSFRFPRLKDIVYDKNPTQANTKNEILSLQKLID